MNKAYLDFIKYCIHPEMEVPSNANFIDWINFMMFCNRQNVMGIVFDGMDKSNLAIPSNVIYEWLAYYESIKKENRVVNLRLAEVSRFFEEKGLRSCVLKGQANGLMYPKPELRSPGDIDIWVEGPPIDIIRIVVKECPDAHYSIHHVKMKKYQDVVVEVHYRPVYLPNWFKDRKLQRYICKKENEQFCHLEVIDGKPVGTLTDEFNLIFQMLHMYNHFFSSRNNLKQLIDYYYLLKKNRFEYNRSEAVKWFKELHVIKYASGVMWVLKEILGMEKEFLIVEPNENVGKVIIKELMNFGINSGESNLSFVWHQFKGNLRLVGIFPSEVLISPLFLVWHQWWKLKMKLRLR